MRYVGGDHQHLSSDGLREQGRNQVLVEHRLCPHEFAVPPHDRNPPSADRHYDMPRAGRVSTTGISSTRSGCGLATIRRHPRSPRFSQCCPAIIRLASVSGR